MDEQEKYEKYCDICRYCSIFFSNIQCSKESVHLGMKREIDSFRNKNCSKELKIIYFLKF